MFRKSLLSLCFASLLVLAGGTVVFAQNAPVSGTVEVTGADGKRTPVEGALVEVFRTDIKASSPPAKTNKKGEFNFAGLQLGWTFILSVSAPGYSPTYLPNVKAGQERLLILMVPGDGRRSSEEEVRAEAAKPVGTTGADVAKNAEDAKKLQAQYEAEKKAVEEKNKKAEETNLVVGNSLKAGNSAFEAKNFDLAIAEYEKGIAADPEYVGSAPILLNNRGIALRMRAVDAYNAGIKVDATERKSYNEKAKKDLAEAGAGYLKSWNLLKNATPTAENKANYDANRLNTLRGAIESFGIAVRTEQVDPSVIDAAKVLIPEYQAIEPDGAKKTAASLTFADLYRIVEDRENAVASYRKVLEGSPDNVDALAYLGIVLVDMGWIKNNDKELSQEGANYLQKFVSVAPDTHKLKTGAVEYLGILKAQSIVPVKTSGPAPRKKP